MSPKCLGCGLHGQEQGIGGAHRHSHLVQRAALHPVVTRRGVAAVAVVRPTDLLHRIQGPTQMAAVALRQRLASHQQGPTMFNKFNRFNRFNIPPDLHLVSPWKPCRVMSVTKFVYTLWTIFLHFSAPTEPGPEPQPASHVPLSWSRRCFQKLASHPFSFCQIFCAVLCSV